MSTMRRSFLGLTLSALVSIASTQAATLTVNSLADNTTSGDGLVTLREAVAAANADTATDLGQSGSGADTIVFDASLAGGTIALSIAGNTTFGPSALAITSDVTIDGDDAPMLTISRDAGVARLRHFYVSGAGSLRLEDITLSNGVARGFDGGATHRGGTGGGGAGLGGSIFNEGDLEIVQSTLNGNQAVGGAGGPQSNIFDTFPRGGSGGGGTAGNGGAPTGADLAFDTGGVGGAGGGGAGGNGGPGAGLCTAGSAGGFGGAGGGGGGSGTDPACSGGAGGFGGGGGGGGGGQAGQAAGPGAAGGFGAGSGGNGQSGDSGTTPGGGGGGGAGLGGAVFNHGGSVSVTNSTFSGNTAQGGAGGRNGAGGSGLGGGIFNRNGMLTVLAATFTGNAGGGIYNLGDAGAGMATISGTILANSTGGNDLHSASINGGSHSSIGTDNLIETSSGFSGSTTSTSDPQLGPLADNDGPTKTHLPALTSPVIDASTLGSPNIDQRGVTRPQGSARDIGSVEVVLNQPPVAVCQNVVVAADANCLGHADADDVDNGSSDPDGDPITLTLSPPGPYPLGVTNVTLTVTDDGDLSDSCQATVTVVDQTPPTINCPPDVVLECPANTSPAATGTATAADNCSTPIITFQDVTVPGCGGTVTITRTWTATDAAGNSSSCVQTVKTVDTTAPTVIPGPNNSVCLWPANHKYVTIDNVTAAVQIVDACDANAEVATVTCVSNQCDDAPCPAKPGENGDGDTTNDCSYDPLNDRLTVRSERAGTDPAGRTYSLYMTAVDGCGNESAPVVVFTVRVPHDQNPDQECIKP